MTLRISALAGAVAGIVSIFYFLGVTAGLNPYISLAISAVASAAVVKWLNPPDDPVEAQPPTAWLRILFFLVLAVSSITFVGIAVKEPHGDWDAWSIWNMHARFLERGGSHWTAMFSKDLNWSHPDYPLLLPALVAQFWSALRTESRYIPIAIAFLFTFGTAATLIGTLRKLRGWDQAMIAGIFALGSAEMVAQGITQYADIPLAFYAVTALALLFFDDVKSLVLAGAMAGFAAWTKNEGLLFVIAVVVARVFARLRFGGGLPALTREIGWMAAGAAPALATLAFFKFKFAPSDELVFNHKSGEIMARALDFGRYVTVVEAYVVELFRAGGFLIPGIIVLGLYAWLVGFKPDPRQRVGLATAIAAVTVTLLGDFAVYVLFSNDVNWQIGTSLPRVFFQMWPAALLAFFAAASKVDLAMAPPPKPVPAKRKAAARRH